MTDRVHPSAKPTTTTTNGAATTANSSLPATKSQFYGASRPTYRPQQPYNHRSRRRSCCCTLFLCLLLTLLILVLLLGIVGTVVYLLYRPHRPSFSVTSLKLTTTPSSTSTLNSMSKFDLTISTTNPNKKIVFSYEPISISILSGDVNIGNGNIPSFENEKMNTTVLRALVSSNMHDAMENHAATKLEGSMKVKMETRVEAKMGVLKTPRVGIRVLCDGITVTLPAGKRKMMPETATAEKTECAVDVRFKVWKWTVG